MLCFNKKRRVEAEESQLITAPIKLNALPEEFKDRIKSIKSTDLI